MAVELSIAEIYTPDPLQRAITGFVQKIRYECRKTDTQGKQILFDTPEIQELIKKTFFKNTGSITTFTS